MKNKKLHKKPSPVGQCHLVKKKCVARDPSVQTYVLSFLGVQTF